MHEMSLAMDVCRIVQENMEPEALPGLTTVAVEIGDDAGVEPESLEFCLEVLLRQPPFTNAKPQLMRVPGDVLRVSYLEVEDGCPND